MNEDRSAVESKIEALQREVMEKQKEMVNLKKSLPPEPVENFTLKDWNGETARLSELFGENDDLIVIHNMGKACSYCTLWADGLNGMTNHLSDRAAFIVVSPDAPDVQKDFATSRGWQFTMYSNEGSDFTQVMGFAVEKDGQTYWLPGYSTFRRKADGSIERIAKDFFGPGDVYCGLWHIFDHLADGSRQWQPKYSYSS